MAAELPKTLRIVGKTYDSVKVPLIDDCGLCEDHTQQIKIDTKMGHDLERDTLLHEAIHAIDYCMQLSMSEKQVNGMGTALYALLNDNPELIKYLIAKPRKGKTNGQDTSMDSQGGKKPKRGTQRQGARKLQRSKSR